jgi:cardiolipin synthase
MKGSTRSQLIRLGATAFVSSLLTLFVKDFISGEKKIKQRIPRRYGIAGGQFERSMSQLPGPPIPDGNRIRRLENGVEIFPAMLAGIARAKETACLETFIYWSGEAAELFSKALSAKTREGVKVHVLIDGMGCDCVEGESLRRMRVAGVELKVYQLDVLRPGYRTRTEWCLRIRADGPSDPGIDPNRAGCGGIPPRGHHFRRHRQGTNPALPIGSAACPRNSR